jgi:hypothetical protein
LSDSFTSELAETDPIHNPETPTSAVDPAPVAKALPRTRFGFDLEHGTPSPRDMRETKPVY